MNEPKMNPLRLSPIDATLLLSKAGGEAVTEAEIRKAIEAGAPVDSDGNVNLVHLGAWLLKETGSAGRQ